MVKSIHHDALNEQSGLTAASGHWHNSHLHGLVSIRGDLQVWSFPTIRVGAYFVVQARDCHWTVGEGCQTWSSGIQRSALLHTIPPRKCLEDTWDCQARLGEYCRFNKRVAEMNIFLFSCPQYTIFLTKVGDIHIPNTSREVTDVVTSPPKADTKDRKGRT